MTIFVTTFFTLLFEGKLSEAKTKWRRNFRLPRLFSNTTTDVTKEKKRKKNFVPCVQLKKQTNPLALKIRIRILIPHFT